MAVVGLALAGGAATGEGLMTLSKDGRYLTAIGHDADVGTVNIATSVSSTISQVIAPSATPTASCTPSWVVVNSPNVGTNTNNLTAVAGSGNNVWAVGYYYTGPATNIWKTLTMHWNGSAWSIVPSPNVGGNSNFLFGVSGSGNDVWAVGYYYTFNGSGTMTLHWDGGAWSVVPSPNASGASGLNAVSGGGNDVWAVGTYSDGSAARTFTLHWDGSTWSQVQSPNVGTESNQLYAVTGSGNDVWAVGYYTFFGQTLTLHWNGSSWSVVASPSPKGHGAAGTFDVPLPLTGNEGVECRSGGATNDYQMIVNFANTVTVESVAVTSGSGSVSSVTVSGSQVTVNLTGVTNAQRITVTLHNVNDGTHMGDVPVSMGVLVGDVNGNGLVNASDVSLTKSQVGAPVSGSNFREDVNANGVINSVDVAQVKANVGTSLPP
jgi:protein involved in ribonucleotide reduction